MVAPSPGPLTRVSARMPCTALHALARKQAQANYTAPRMNPSSLGSAVSDIPQGSDEIQRLVIARTLE